MGEPTAAVYLTGGTARGAKLLSVPGLDVRPALARVRKSLFDILRPRLEEARIADLFAGTGSLALEALSRGAAFALLYDVDARCIEVLKKNLAKLKFEGRAEVRRTSAFETETAEAFDVVFIDPPYAFYVERRAEMEKLVAGWILRLAPGGRMLVEHRPKEGFGESFPGARRVDERRYGGTVVSFYERA